MPRPGPMDEGADGGHLWRLVGPLAQMRFVGQSAVYEARDAPARARAVIIGRIKLHHRLATCMDPLPASLWLLAGVMAQLVLAAGPTVRRAVRDEGPAVLVTGAVVLAVLAALAFLPYHLIVPGPGAYAAYRNVLVFAFLLVVGFGFVLGPKVAPLTTGPAMAVIFALGGLVAAKLTAGFGIGPWWGLGAYLIAFLWFGWLLVRLTRISPQAAGHHVQGSASLPVRGQAYVAYLVLMIFLVVSRGAGPAYEVLTGAEVASGPMALLTAGMVVAYGMLLLGSSRPSMASPDQDAQAGWQAMARRVGRPSSLGATAAAACITVVGGLLVALWAPGVTEVAINLTLVAVPWGGHLWARRWDQATTHGSRTWPEGF